MSLEQIERMFENFAEHFRLFDTPIKARFAWHGGEPLLVPPEFYREMRKIQQKVFTDEHVQVANTVQTNMTVLDDERLDLLLNTFDGVGVSLDLYSGLRVNKLNVCQENRAIENLDHAISKGLSAQGITVLTASTIDKTAEIYKFWRDRRMSFRVLPIEKGMYEAGQGFEVNATDTCKAMCDYADHWFQDDEPVNIEPIHRHIQMLMHSTQGKEFGVRKYDKSKWHNVLLVDTDGTLYGYNDRFDTTRSPGNIFTESLSDMFRKDIHLKVVEEVQNRMNASCFDCDYWGKSCTGFPIGEGELNFSDLRPDGATDCVVTKGLIGHLTARLKQAGVLDQNSGLHTEAFLGA